MSDAPLTVYTVGHSTRSLDELVGLLHDAGVRQVVDVRSVPRSRHNPQFNAEALQGDLPARGIAYEHMPGLGGFRRARPGSPNSGLTHPGFRGYADYMGTAAFAVARERLLGLAAERPTAIMCAEASPYRCHRRLLSDSLSVAGVRVVHIVARGRSEPHQIKPPAVVRDGSLSYPAEPDGQLPLFGT